MDASGNSRNSSPVAQYHEQFVRTALAFLA